MVLAQGMPDLTIAVKKFYRLTRAYLNVIREVGSDTLNHENYSV